jgi:hypothetical protein
MDIKLYLYLYCYKLKLLSQQPKNGHKNYVNKK